MIKQNHIITFKESNKNFLKKKKKEKEKGIKQECFEFLLKDICMYDKCCICRPCRVFRVSLVD